MQLWPPLDLVIETRDPSSPKIILDILLSFDFVTCDVEDEVSAEFEKWLLNRDDNEDREH
jgi:hypothetical protein